MRRVSTLPTHGQHTVSHTANTPSTDTRHNHSIPVFAAALGGSSELLVDPDLLDEVLQEGPLQT